MMWLVSKFLSSVRHNKSTKEELLRARLGKQRNRLPRKVMASQARESTKTSMKPYRGFCFIVQDELIKCSEFRVWVNMSYRYNH